MSIRMSVTELDAYRYYRHNEDADLEDFLAQLRKQTPPTQAMLAGSAWHKALERMEWTTDEAEVVRQDGFTFRIAADIELSLPEVAELKGEIGIDTAAGPVTLVGVVDGIDAKGVRDYKLSRSFDAERYTDSYQWRCYLLMFGAQRFVYEVFVGREDERSGEFVIREYHQLPVCAYPGMAEDVRREVGELAAFITRYLPERVLQPVAA